MQAQLPIVGSHRTSYRRKWPSWKLAGPWLGGLLCLLSGIGGIPWATAADLEFAHGLYRQKRYDLAIREYEAYLEEQQSRDTSEAAEARFYLAESYIQTKQSNKAIPLYERLSQSRQATAEQLRLSLFRVGELQYVAGQADAARAALTRFLRDYPQDELAGFAAYYLGDLFLQASDLANAQQWLRQANDSTKDAKANAALKENILFALGRLAERQQQWDTAAASYRQLLALPKSNRSAEALLGLGAIYYRQQQWSQARQTFADFLQRFPQNHFAPVATLNLGLSLRKLGSAEEARQQFEAVLADPRSRSNPDLAAEAIEQIGWVYSDQGKLAEAGRWWSQQAQRVTDPGKQANLRLQAAWSLMESNQLDEADRQLEQLRQNAGAATAAVRERASFYQLQVAARQGNKSLVEQRFRDFRQQYPRSEWVGDATLAFAETLAGNKAGPADAATVQEIAQVAKEILDPKIQQVLYYYLAVLLHERQDHEKATGVLSWLLKQNPSPEIARKCNYLLALNQLKLKMWDEASERLEQFLQESAGSQEPNTDQLRAVAWQGLAAAAVHLTAPDRRQAVIDKLLAALPQSNELAANLLALADHLYRAQEIRQAGKIYQALLKTKLRAVDRSSCLLGLAWCLHDMQQFAAAYEYFRQAADSRAGQSAADQQLIAEAHFMAGTSAEAAKQLAEARQAYQEVFTKFPTSRQAVAAVLRTARLLEQQGKSQEAERLLISIFDSSTRGSTWSEEQKAELLYEAAWLALEGNRADSAKSNFERLVQDFPQSSFMPEATLKLVELAHRKQDYKQAADWLSRLEKKSVPGELQPLQLYWRALTAQKLQQARLAETAFTELLKQFPNDRLAGVAQFQLAELAFERQDMAMARLAYKEVLARSECEEYHPLSRLRLAQCALVAEDWQEADSAANQVLRDSNDPVTQAEARYVRARVLQQRGKLTEARQEFAKVLSDRRSELDAKTQFMIGECLFFQRQYEEAIKAFLKVEILYPYPVWQASAILEIGKCYEKMQRLDEARTEFQRLIDKFPNEVASQLARDRLRQLQSSKTP